MAFQERKKEKVFDFHIYFANFTNQHLNKCMAAFARNVCVCVCVETRSHCRSGLFSRWEKRTPLPHVYVWKPWTALHVVKLRLIVYIKFFIKLCEALNTLGVLLKEKVNMAPNV